MTDPLVASIRRRLAEGGPTQPTAPAEPPPRELSPLGFYSHAAEQAQALPQEQGTPDQYKGMLTKRGVSPEEFKWSGYDKAFAGQKRIRKGDLAKHFRANMPKLQETVLGKPPRGPIPFGEPIDEGEGETKFSDYTLPGGKNYREHLLHLAADRPSQQELEDHALGMWAKPFNELTAEERRALEKDIQINAPKQGSYISSHWDVPNVLAHLRLSDRDLPGGKKALHLEELQSDWAQEGRKKGFADPEKSADMERRSTEAMNRTVALNAEMDRMAKIRDPVTNRITDEPQWHRLANERDAARQEMETLAKQAREGVPAAPFVGSTQKWVNMGLQRLLHHAAQGGYDKLVMTPGQEQADRYDLSQHLRQVIAKRDPETGMIGINAYAHGNDNAVHADHHDAKDLPGVVGKELAERIHKDTSEAPGRTHVYNGLDLKVGGEGMKAFYDTILPMSLEKIARQHDPQAKVKLHGAEVGHKFKRQTGSAFRTPPNIAEMPPHLRDIAIMGTLGIGTTDWDAMSETQREHARQHGSVPGTKVHSLDITPAMRKSILAKGHRTFEAGGAVEPELLHRALSGRSRPPDGGFVARAFRAR